MSGQVRFNQTASPPSADTTADSSRQNAAAESPLADPPAASVSSPPTLATNRNRRMLLARAAASEASPAAATPPLRVVDVRGDGNCLFRALAVVTGHNEEDHEAIRRIAVEAASTRYDLAQLQASASDTVPPYQTVTDYLDTMLKPAHGDETGWGGAIEMAAFADATATRLIVHDPTSGMPRQEFGPRAGPEHHIVRQSPDHFAALLPDTHRSDQSSKSLSDLPGDVLKTILTGLEQARNVRSLAMLSQTNRSFSTLVLADPESAQKRAIGQTIGDLKSHFIRAARANDETAITELLQPLLERSPFLNNYEPDDRVGLQAAAAAAVRMIRSGSQRLSWVAVLESLTALALRPPSAAISFTTAAKSAVYGLSRSAGHTTPPPKLRVSNRQIELLEAIVYKIRNGPRSEMQHLSGLVSNLIKTTLQGVRNKTISNQYGKVLSCFLDDTSNLSASQVRDLIDVVLHQLPPTTQATVLDMAGIDLEKLAEDQRQQVLALYQAAITDPDNGPDNETVQAKALISISTIPSPIERDRLHKHLLGLAPNFAECLEEALDTAAATSARVLEGLIHHVTTVSPSLDSQDLLRDGGHLAKLLLQAVEYGRPTAATMLARFAAESDLPSAEVEQMLNGGPLSEKVLQQTPLMAAIGTGSVALMDDLKQALHATNLPPRSIEAILAQRSRADHDTRRGLAAFPYLMGHSADYIARPALVAYGDMLRELGLDAAAQTRLLSALGNTGFAPLYNSIRDSRVGLVKTFGEVLASLSLPPASLNTLLTLTDPRGTHILDTPDLHEAPKGVAALVGLVQSLSPPADVMRSILNFTADTNGRWISTGIASSQPAEAPLIWRQPAPITPGDSKGAAAFKTALQTLYNTLLSRQIQDG